MVDDFTLMSYILLIFLAIGFGGILYTFYNFESLALQDGEEVRSGSTTPSSAHRSTLPGAR